MNFLHQEPQWKWDIGLMMGATLSRKVQEAKQARSWVDQPSPVDTATLLVLAQPNITFETPSGQLRIKKDFVVKISNNLFELKPGDLSISYEGSDWAMAIYQKQDGSYVIGNSDAVARAFAQDLVDIVSGPDRKYWIVKKKVSQRASLGIEGDLEPSLNGKFVCATGVIGDHAKAELKVAKQTWGDWVTQIGVEIGL
jgi:hypothetical protein